MGARSDEAHGSSTPSSTWCAAGSLDERISRSGSDAADALANTGGIVGWGRAVTRRHGSARVDTGESELPVTTTRIPRSHTGGGSMLYSVKQDPTEQNPPTNKRSKS